MRKIKKIKKITKSKGKPAQELRLLTCGDAIQLSKFKRRVRLSKAGKAFVNQSPAQFFGNQIFGDLLTVEELAVIFRVSPQTIRNWVARGKIPHIQIGRRNLFHLRRLQQWLIQKEEPQWQ